MGATATLAEFASAANQRVIPDDILQATQVLMLDSIGCALGGHLLKAGQLAVAYAERQAGSSTIIGGSKNVTPEAAIFANGQLMNVLDLEEVMLNWGHHIPFVLPVALTVGEQLGSTGMDVVRAVAIGYEVAARVSAALAGPVRAVGSPPNLALESLPLFGYSANIFGGVAAAAVLKRLSQDQVEHAFGVASYLAPVANAGGFAAGPNLPMSRYGLMGAAAQSAYTAATLAEMGFTSARNVLDGLNGFPKLVGSPRFATDDMTNALGTDWWIPKVSYKLYPSCRMAHVGIDNLTSLLREHEIAAAEIDKISIKVWPRVSGSPLFRNVAPQDPLDAQFSLPYIVATTVYGMNTYPTFFAKDTMNDPRILAMARKVEVLPEPRLIAARFERHGDQPIGPIDSVPCEVQVHTARSTFTAYAETAMGDSFDPDKRISVEQLCGKFRTCAAARLTPANTTAAERLILNLVSQGSVRELMNALCH